MITTRVTMNLLPVLVVCLSAVGFGGGARILGILPMPSRSHSILLERLMRELGERGHTITYIAASPPSSPILNVEVIHVPGVRDALLSKIPVFKNRTVTSRRGNPWMSLFFSNKMSESLSEEMLGDENVKALIASDREFDLVLGEIMMDESLLAGFSYKFKAPIVAFATTMPMYSANYLVGNVVPSSYIPDVFMGYGSKMTLWERLHNHAYSLATELMYKLWLLPRQDEVMRKHFGQNAPYIGDILRNTSLVLVNHHHALGFARPYATNMIEVAGVHINEPRALPAALQKFMDSADGVLLFSLGSNFNSSDLSTDKISAILEGFSRLPLKVLWKFEESLNNTPSNVRIEKWLPQTDLLAHQNLKLFITHGGLLSITEAMSLGVPVVGVPLGGDQHVNMRQVEDAGWGKTLQLDDITADSLYDVVSEVLNNPRYKENALQKSALLKDNPMPPLERAVWWIEFVLRNGGEQLKSAAQDLAWYQVYLLDVLTVVTILASIVFFVLLKILKIVFGLFKLTMLF